MPPTPPILRQLVRSSFSGGTAFNLSRSRSPQTPWFPSHLRLGEPPPSICLRCRFRTQLRTYSNGDYKDGKATQTQFSFGENKGKAQTSSATGHEFPADPTSSSLEEGDDISQKEEPTLRPSWSNPNPGHHRDELPSQEEGRRSRLSRSFSDIMDNFQSNIFIAGQRLNDLTGYSGIEALKKEIEHREANLKATRANLRQAKEAYTGAITRRSSSQREVNELLQRKHAWAPADLERFTSLYRSDHANEQAEAAAQEALATAEREAEEAATSLNRTILARYHEEQIWSDKIRRMSTWGTWGLMGVNVVLFLVFQVLVEPWRRKRLVKGFEEKVAEALEKEGGAVQGGDGVGVAGAARAEDIEESSSGVTSPAAAAAAVPAVTPSPATSMKEREAFAAPGSSSTGTSAGPGTFVGIDPNPIVAIQSLPIDAPSPPPPPSFSSSSESPRTRHGQSTSPSPPAADAPPPVFEDYKAMVQDLFSDRVVSMTQRDLSTVALEGFAAGAAFVGFIVVLLRPK